jgi:hypothetical protein
LDRRDDGAQQLRLREWAEHRCDRRPEQRPSALPGDVTVDDVPEGVVTGRVYSRQGRQVAPGVEVEQVAGLARRLPRHRKRVDDQLQAGRRAGQLRVVEPLREIAPGD